MQFHRLHPSNCVPDEATQRSKSIHDDKNADKLNVFLESGDLSGHKTKNAVKFAKRRFYANINKTKDWALVHERELLVF